MHVEYTTPDLHERRTHVVHIYVSISHELLCVDNNKKTVRIIQYWAHGLWAYIRWIYNKGI